MPKPAYPVTCTTFAGVRPRPVDAIDLPWADFVAHTLPELVASERREKRKLPGIVLAPVKGRRTDDHTGAHTALSIDVDHIPGNDLGWLLKRAKRLRCAVYETPSSTDDAPRVRVIAALRKPLDPERVVAARLALAEALGLDAQRCGTARAVAVSQVMFAGRINGTRERGLWVYDGEVWVPPRSAAPTPKNQSSPRSTERRVRVDLERESQGADAFPFDAPPDLSAVAKHVPPAGVDGDRHLLVRGLGGWLARRGYDPQAIAEAVALQIPASDPAERAAQAREAAERVLAGLESPGWDALCQWAEAHANGARTLGRLERACKDPREPQGWGAADGTGEVWSEWWARVWPRWVARGCKAEWAATPAADLPEGEQDGTGLHLHPSTGWPWILQRGDTYWLHSIEADTYAAEVRACELEASVARNLAGLVSDEDRKPSELRASWVKPIASLRVTYPARKHAYDPASNTLTLAALRWTTREARRHAHIDRWLRALFGEGYDAAAQWIASLCELTRPAPCLYLPGPRGLGKSLLADGLAALWSRPAPVDMAEAIDSFNEASAECPLIFTDEGFPEGLDFNSFRKMITQHSRRVNVKFRSKCDVEGCGRFMIAANNADVLRYQKIGTLTADDLDAIADRLLVVPCHVEARAAVDALDTAAAATGEIAEHALWLASTVPLEPAGRMAAKPGGGEQILASVVAGRSADILARVRESLGAGQLGERSGVRRRKGEVWINVMRLHDTFGGRVQLAAVREFCDSFQLREGTEQHKTDDGENLRWRVLDRERLNEAFERLD